MKSLQQITEDLQKISTNILKELITKHGFLNSLEYAKKNIGIDCNISQNSDGDFIMPRNPRSFCISLIKEMFLENNYYYFRKALNDYIEKFLSTKPTIGCRRYIFPEINIIIYNILDHKDDNYRAYLTIADGNIEEMEYKTKRFCDAIERQQQEIAKEFTE